VPMTIRKRRRRKNPRILIVTPEITYLPDGMGNMANRMTAKAGGLADVSSSLVAALFEIGADVHVALPHYRRMFHIDAGKLINEELRVYMNKLPKAQIHLAEDRCFYYRDSVYANYECTNMKVALAFQREVINNIIPSVDPDLIHCNDWMTGLVPAAARRLGIPSLFTVHNIHTNNLTLAQIEDAGIDAAEFWKYLFFTEQPYNYEAVRNHNPVDLLASGIFSSHFINTVSPTFLDEVCHGDHDFVPPKIRHEMLQKRDNECASGILNAPDPSNNPETDEHIPHHYTAETHAEGKRLNKCRFQERVGLAVDPDAPIFFWPSRLDPIQKGCQLLADILYETVSAHWDSRLQIAFVANGSYQGIFHDIVKQHDIGNRVAVCDFSEPLSRHGYAASDFMIIPSRFEPCGLPQMVSSIYGSLPIARDTGGLHDTVENVDIANNSGNGFLFETYDGTGLRWAIDQAMNFYKQSAVVREQQIARIMRESLDRFNHQVTAEAYFGIYEKMLDRPIVRDY
jgi:starch synthase